MRPVALRPTSNRWRWAFAVYVAGEARLVVVGGGGQKLFPERGAALAPQRRPSGIRRRRVRSLAFLAKVISVLEADHPRLIDAGQPRAPDRSAARIGRRAGTTNRPQAPAHRPPTCRLRACPRTTTAPTGRTRYSVSPRPNPTTLRGWRKELAARPQPNSLRDCQRIRRLHCEPFRDG